MEAVSLAISSLILLPHCSRCLHVFSRLTLNSQASCLYLLCSWDYSLSSLIMPYWMIHLAYLPLISFLCWVEISVLLRVSYRFHGLIRINPTCRQSPWEFAWQGADAEGIGVLMSMLPFLSLTGTLAQRVRWYLWGEPWSVTRLECKSTWF